MAKHYKQNRNAAASKTATAQADKPAPQPTGKAKQERKVLLPMAVVFFILVWLWAWLWYGDVFRIARESSFWAPDSTLMSYLKGRPWEALWWMGHALLQLYRWPPVGALVTATLVSGSTWLLGYCLRLRGWWRLLQYLPAAIYMSVTAYVGFDLYFETETGMIFGIPLLCFIVLLIMAFIIRSFSHSHRFPPLFYPPRDETTLLNRVQLAAAVLAVALPIGITQWLRPYVRVVTHMQVQMMRQDWKGMTETALAHAELSYRPIAAYYAIALVQMGEQGSRLFNIRLDYDEPYMHGFHQRGTNETNYYLMECDFNAGLIQTAIHHAMEHMTMNGPTLRSLKMLTKCALLTGEWKVAEKYLHILQKTPFEGDFVAKYQPMLYNPERVDNDPEFKMVRLTEPIHDHFENFFIPPTFLGYNAALTEGRSVNALWNSLLVNIYTKTMPQFIERCYPLQGTTPPQSISEALMLMSAKYPQVAQGFPSLGYNRDRIVTFMQDVKPYLGSHESRAAHARELFPKWKGYYPYYYFFGNLKATKRKNRDNEGSSNQGVN